MCLNGNSHILCPKVIHSSERSGSSVLYCIEAGRCESFAVPQDAADGCEVGESCLRWPVGERPIAIFSSSSALQAVEVGNFAVSASGRGLGGSMLGHSRSFEACCQSSCPEWVAGIAFSPSVADLALAAVIVRSGFAAAGTTIEFGWNGISKSAIYLRCGQASCDATPSGYI